MEQLQPDPLVDMTSEDLNDLRKELKLYADRLDNLILPKWSNAFEISDKLYELEEMVEAHGHQSDGLAHMQGLTVW